MSSPKIIWWQTLLCKNIMLQWLKTKSINAKMRGSSPHTCNLVLSSVRLGC
jgi:hypothetical protein